jgi:dTDP-4-dehydrorhamnose 3,5-epimerase-like enzyme
MGFPYQEPTLLRGGSAADDRGILSFVNDFAFPGVKRFYLIENFTKGFVRAWHAHKLEGKYMVALHGSFVVGAVKVDDFEKPGTSLKAQRVVISDRTPSVFAIPPGYANGLMGLTEGAKLLIFSTTSLEESKGDDYRFPARHWDIWGVEER